MKIQITIDGRKVTATLTSNRATHDFIDLLPLDLEFEDYAQIEKISYLPRKLNVEGVPDGYNPSIGDITYYAPWGNLAIFYKDHGYAKGLVELGSIEDGIEVIKSDGPFEGRIELVE